MHKVSPLIAVIAGELSGDLLGAALITALRKLHPQARFYGVVGARMQAAGCEAIASIDTLSVMGLAEVLPALPRLFRLRAQLIERFVTDRPDIVIGIDAPDFNLGLERRLKQRGLRTAHVVSPTVWAWRQNRVKTIACSTDLMLCLFPFEPPFYEGHAVAARYIGHPLADELEASMTPPQARETIGLQEEGPVLAILPGSRRGELKYLAEPFARTAAWLHSRVPGLRVVTPIAKPQLHGMLEAAIANHAPQVNWTLLDGQSREAMRAADVVLLASGTATLECLLLGRPMVVAYRTSRLTAWLMLQMGLLKTRHVSLPNLLAGDAVVPELLQDAASPERLGAELLGLLEREAARSEQLRSFDSVRTELKRDSASVAARAISELLSG